MQLYVSKDWTKKLNMARNVFAAHDTRKPQASTLHSGVEVWLQQNVQTHQGV